MQILNTSKQLHEVKSVNQDKKKLQKAITWDGTLSSTLQLIKKKELSIKI